MHASLIVMLALANVTERHTEPGLLVRGVEGCRDQKHCSSKQESKKRGPECWCLVGAYLLCCRPGLASLVSVPLFMCVPAGPHSVLPSKIERSKAPQLSVTHVHPVAHAQSHVF